MVIVRIWSDHIPTNAGFCGDLSDWKQIEAFEAQKNTSIHSEFLAHNEAHALEIIEAFYNETDIDCNYFIEE